MNDKLRKEVKYLKVFQNMKYKDIAELLEIRTDSFYNWLNKQYDFGTERIERLREIIDLIKEY